MLVGVNAFFRQSMGDLTVMGWMPSKAIRCSQEWSWIAPESGAAQIRSRLRGKGIHGRIL